MKLTGERNIFMTLSCLIIMLYSVQTAHGGMRQYLKKNFITVSGRVQSSYTASPPGTNKLGFHLKLTSASRRYIIHVGPQWYVDNNPEQFKFKKGDLVTVSGARFATGRTKNNIYAATLINHSSGILKLQLRNPDTGAGLWSGRFRSQIREIVRNRMKIKMQKAVKADILRRKIKKDTIRVAMFRSGRSGDQSHLRRNTFSSTGLLKTSSTRSFVAPVTQ